jgi:hypothetical protein
VRDKKYILIFVIIAAAASIPLMGNFLYRGHDIYFHLMRIEGLAEGIRNGEFPVKIQPLWYGGYGYSVSVFYGDLFLYIGAFLRLIGFSLRGAYKGYVVFINMITVLIAACSFGRISGNKTIGSVCAFLYGLSSYRLVNLYTRGAVGEYTAMTFLPLVAYACVLLLNSDKDLKKIKKGAVILGISMAFIIQSHILTAELVSMALAGVMVLHIRKVCNRKVILSGICAILLAVLLSLWFIVPLFDYMSQGIFKVNYVEGGTMIQSQGVFISQILALFDNAVGESLDWRTGTEGDFAQGAGLALVISLVFFAVLYLMAGKRQTERKIKEIGFTAAFAAVVLLVMSSRYFPWDRLCSISSTLKYIIINIQFPWRFTGIAALMLVLVWCMVFVMELNISGKKLSIFMVIALLLSSMTAGHYMADLWNRAQKIQVHSIEDMDTYVASGEEYLPADTEAENLLNDSLTVEGVEISGYNKYGNRIAFHCKSTSSDEGIVELPLLYYKGYKASGRDLQGNDVNIDITAGSNHVIRLIIKSGTECDISVQFKEPWYWRAAEAVSLITVAGVIIAYIVYGGNGYRRKLWSQN